MKIKIVLLLLMVVLLASCTNCRKYKYCIRTHRYSYHTNEYTKDGDGCISFIDIGGRKRTVCGSFSITDNTQR
jgi:hypothetical protein